LHSELVTRVQEGYGARRYRYLADKGVMDRGDLMFMMESETFEVRGTD
jgi:hypothetical protein